MKIYLDENIPFDCKDINGISCKKVQAGTPDAQIAKYCKTHGYILITKDKDFLKYDIPLILLEGNDKHIRNQFNSVVKRLATVLEECKSKRIFVRFRAKGTQIKCL